MSGETTLTIVGNLTGDPELRFTSSGAAVASFTVASTPRTFDKQANAWKDGEPLFMRCSLWRQAGENAAESLTKGMRVIVVGNLKQRSYEKDGQKRTVIEMDVDEIGPSLKYATAKVVKADRNGGGGSGQSGSGGQRQGNGNQQQSGSWGGGQGQQGSNGGGWGGGNDGGWSGSNNDAPPF